jgi:hypothetical protein
VENAAAKVGESLALGERGLRLGRFEVQGGTATLQVILDIPQPVIPITCTLTDATGKTMRFQMPSGTTRNMGVDAIKGPYKLALRGPDLTRDLVLAFELKDIPLP